jgi:hypothetical protein
VTRPEVPVPSSRVMSMLCSAAILRTRGLERVRRSSSAVRSAFMRSAAGGCSVAEVPEAVGAGCGGGAAGAEEGCGAVARCCGAGCGAGAGCGGGGAETAA